MNSSSFNYDIRILSLKILLDNFDQWLHLYITFITKPYLKNLIHGIFINLTLDVVILKFSLRQFRNDNCTEIFKSLAESMAKASNKLLSFVSQQITSDIITLFLLVYIKFERILLP